MPEVNVFDHPEFRNHESVLHWNDPDAGLRAIIAVHSTRRGPALGGCRMYAYPSGEAALYDVLRLSRGMTYKSALADLPLGGGKSVILGDPRADKTPALMRAMGRAVDSLGGRYIVAEDSGTGVEDLKRIRTQTRHVVGIAETRGWDGRLRDGDPSPATAYGCFVGLKATVRQRLGTDCLRGLRVAIQGFGNVGRNLAQLLHDAGAELWVSDVDCNRTSHAAQLFGAKPVAPDAFFDADVDVLAPCALGAILNDQTIDRIRATVIAGSANNQLAEPRHGDALAEREILYAPDYAINAGGIIDVAYELQTYDAGAVKQRLDAIGQTLTEIFRRAQESGIAPHRVADQLAEERLRAPARGVRATSISDAA